MSTTRRIEVFTAGCSLCTDTLNLVNEAVKDCGCEVIERRCPETEQCDEAKAYGVRTMPTIVVDGAILFEGKPSREQAIALLRR